MRNQHIFAALTAAFGLLANSANAQDNYLGEIILGGFNFCPRTTLAAEGQLLAISQNQALFSLMGTTYGGDGRTTFGLPDLRGRVAVHAGSGNGLSSYSQGQKGGSESITMTLNQLPAHNHTVKVGQVAQAPSDGDGMSGPTTPPGTEETGNSMHVFNRTSYVSGVNDVVGTTGGGQPIDNMQPYNVISFCVVTQGIFPSRN